MAITHIDECCGQPGFIRDHFPVPHIPNYLFLLVRFNQDIDWLNDNMTELDRQNESRLLITVWL